MITKDVLFLLTPFTSLPAGDDRCVCAGYVDYFVKYILIA